MSKQAIKTVAIVGGSTAGWAVAAALSQGLQARGVQVLVLQSGEDTPGAVAEATLPSSVAFQGMHGMDERDLMRGTRATFRLGNEYVDWWGSQQPHFGSLGHHGAGIGALHFQHYYSKARLNGDDTPFNAYSLNAVAARAGKFTHPEPDRRSALSTLMYGQHLDNAWYYLYLRGFSEYHGARCIAGELQSVAVSADDGFITSLKLADGQSIEADLFIDCTGNEARLIGDALGVEFEDWSHWLPSDSVVCVNLPPELEPAPYTRVRAVEQGFVRDIPLQDRVVRELHYRAELTPDEQAIGALRALSPMAGSAPPVTRRLRCGRHTRAWQANCVALGPAAGGVEALVMGDLHFAESLVLKLLDLFPDRDCAPVLADEFNRLSRLQMELARDFNILHYQTATLTGSAFWDRACAEPPPARVAQRVELFNSQSEIPAYDEEIHGISHWVSLMFGQGMQPQAYSRALDALDWQRLQQRFEHMQQTIRDTSNAMPSQRDYLLQYLRPAQGQA